jgi:hypothetical protein
VPRQSSGWMWDLTITPSHDFYVAAATTALLVHNDECGSVSEYDTVPYRPTNPGFENHHGILDAWAKNNIPGYVSRAADNPTMALTEGNHAAATAVSREWLTEMTGRPVGGKIDWNQVGPREIQGLGNRMFAAAGAPAESVQAYYRAFNQYIYGSG